MGKDGFLTPKAIANRIKAKGLQKLRWYCQMCEKQCRDANGFKCHCESESHQRNMILFSQNAGRLINDFSREFERDFLDIVKRRAKTTFIYANLVYNELISNRTHVHMNATCWVTLSNFIRYLGREGKCVVEERPKGWFIMYNERDPEVLAKQERMAGIDRHEADEEERQRRFIEQQINMAKEKGVAEESAPTELRKDAPLNLSLTFNRPNAAAVAAAQAINKNELAKAFDITTEKEASKKKLDEKEKPKRVGNEDEEEEEEEEDADEEVVETAEDLAAAEEFRKQMDAVLLKRDAEYDTMKKEKEEGSSASKPPKTEKSEPEKKKPPTADRRDDKSDTSSQKGGDHKSKFTDSGSSSSAAAGAASKRKLSALDAIMLEQEQKKERSNRKAYWLDEGIVVKCINKKLADGKYYKKKGVVEEVMDKFVGLIRMIDSEVDGHKLKLDQSQLETVLPAPGGRVRIVNGAYRGSSAVLLSVDVEKFCANLRIDAGPHNGRLVEHVAYEDICKIYSP